MPEVDVKKNQREEKGVSRRRDTEVSNWGGWDPLAWWRTPSDFFTDPLLHMRRFREDMDRVFSRAFGEEQGMGPVWSPAIEVHEQNGKLQVHAELPGLKPEDVKIQVTDDSLIIEGERKSEHEERNKGVYRSERRYGKFYRTIPLPEGANTDQAKAEFHDGVLQVTLPVPERKSNRREIPISGENVTGNRK
jgi:HSP20 family protein